MRLRHRTPTTFTLSMMDVLCCALGCVILLWLLNTRESKMRARTASETYARLQETMARLDATAADLESAQIEMTALTIHRDELQQTLDSIRKQLAVLRVQKADSDEKLAAKSKEAEGLVLDLKSAKELAAALELATQQKDVLLTAMSKKSADLTEKLAAAETAAELLRRRADQLTTVQAESKAMAGKFSSAQARVQDLEKKLADVQKDLDDSQRSVIDLQGQKRSIAEKLDAVRAAADNRFAGIDLKGRRVVFLIDISGSMKLLDDTTPAPMKWPGVIETVLRIARSLPDLEKYQVILFSTGVSFLLGGEGGWLTYDKELSPRQLAAALRVTEPRGHTNMYAGMEAAFALRDQGLDTIYLFSDGLPNAGPGLTAREQQLDERERTALYSKYIRSILATKWNRPRGDGRRVVIHTIGFFYESPDLGAFLWALARDNDGSFVGMSRP